MMKTVSETTQVYRVYIKASPQAVWDAITKPEWTEKYGYGGRSVYDLRPGGTYRGYTSDAMKKAGAARGGRVPDVAIEGEVIAADAPRKLVLMWSCWKRWSGRVTSSGLAAKDAATSRTWSP